jgi:hypothetical protein
MDQVRKRTAQRMGMLGPLLNRKNDLSVRNGALLYKQLIHPVMVTGAAIQVRSPCYWCPWYVSNRQIHEDLGVPLFAEHIRKLTATFESKLADVGNPHIRQIG